MDGIWPYINKVGNQRGVAPDQGACMVMAYPTAESLGLYRLVVHLGGVSSP